MQDSLDDDASAGNDDPNRVDKDSPKEDFGGSVAEEDSTPVDSEYVQDYSDRKREPVGPRIPCPNSVRDNTPDTEGVLPFPPEPPIRAVGSSAHASVDPGGDFSDGYDERYRLLCIGVIFNFFPGFFVSYLLIDYLQFDVY